MAEIVIWQIGRRGLVLFPDISATLRSSGEGLRAATLEIPVTFEHINVDRWGKARAIFVAADGTQFEVAVESGELANHLAALVEVQSAR